jgi:hypothetical protein
MARKGTFILLDSVIFFVGIALEQGFLQDKVFCRMSSAELKELVDLALRNEVD